ncbi:hypothetical protein [Sphingopyxis sp.]|uniref:hypothetical protein n=1 Tax=Sphingopyxis sp. TaxID=1908224 RepID=UPI003D125BCE
MIDQRLVAYALEAVDTSNFEKFAQTFYGAMQDREFVPLGGLHDGGAEGYDAFGPEIAADEEASSFIQVSKQVATNQKIRQTVHRLREYGRTPKVLTYITSQTVKDIDKIEKKLGDDLGCRIAIRDARYIEININTNSATQGAFYSYLQPAIAEAYSPGNSEVAQEIDRYADRTLAVFLRQEVDSRASRSSLLESVSDSLIIWALRDTDPDKSILLTRDEVLSTIEQALPTAKSFIRNSIDRRLLVLSAKDAPGGRQLRKYAKTDQYCLPFETRTIVAVENAEDDLIKLKVSCVFEDRLTALSGDEVDQWRQIIVASCHSALEQVFERQGLKVAQFAVNADVDDETFTDVSSIATKIVDDLNVDSESKSIIRRHVLMVLRGTFYASDETERLYLGKLSRTYVLMMLLKNEPKIVEYFSSMAGSFNIYVGSDILIRALSEIYLSPESQSTGNLLEILKKCGSDLILTETTVEEVATHIRRQIFEFENVYAMAEHHVRLDAVEYIDRLLIRSYFYARLSPVSGVAAPKNWLSYINRFGSYKDLRANRGDNELAAFLMRRFGLTYESTAQSQVGVDKDELQALKTSILEAKAHPSRDSETDEILAYNDALQILRVYERRRISKESSPGNPFGFKTWWLTQDGKVRRAAAATRVKHAGNGFMMRPELLMAYVGSLPSLAEVRASYRTIFPSVLGVRLASGIRDSDFKKVMRDAAEIVDVDDARAGAMVSAMVKRLQNDTAKDFGTNWQGPLGR